MTASHAAASQRDASGRAAAVTAGGQSYRLTADIAGERLDTFLARLVPDVSRSRVQRLIAAGHALVEGRAARSAARLKPGDTVELELPPPVASELVPEPMALRVAYEDADVLVVDKPSGMVVHPAPGHIAGTLVHGLLAYCTDLSGIGGELRPGIVHRLDRDTSGLLMVAKNDRAHASLAEQLARRSVDKFYLALVRGVPNPERGIIDAPIGRHPAERQRMAVRPGGRPSRTRYATLARVGGFSLVVAGLDTGRTHQIRVHFAALGCPVVGDPIYGAAAGPAGRLWLHAWRLAFDRPSDGARVELEAPLPRELAESWMQLGREAQPADPAECALARARRWAGEQSHAWSATVTTE